MLILFYSINYWLKLTCGPQCWSHTCSTLWGATTTSRYLLSQDSKWLVFQENIYMSCLKHSNNQCCDFSGDDSHYLTLFYFIVLPLLSLIEWVYVRCITNFKWLVHTEIGNVDLLSSSVTMETEKYFSLPLFSSYWFSSCWQSGRDKTSLSLTFSLFPFPRRSLYKLCFPFSITKSLFLLNVCSPFIASLSPSLLSSHRGLAPHAFAFLCWVFFFFNSFISALEREDNLQWPCLSFLYQVWQSKKCLGTFWTGRSK